MKKFLSLLLFMSLNSWATCNFKSDVKKVISLSGATSSTFRELGLLKNARLYGISVFNPISKKEFNGKFFPGGIFLSPSALKEFENGLIFFDESRDLARMFNSQSKSLSKEIKTRGKTPREVIDSTLLVLSPYLENCDEKIKKLYLKVATLENQLIKMVPKDFEVIFYLGGFKHERRPEMVMVNDGIVKWFVQKKLIKTYPTELAYINWSSKIMNSVSKKALHLGVEDSYQTSHKEVKKSVHWMNLIYPGALTPGITQLEAFHYWLTNI